MLSYADLCILALTYSLHVRTKEENSEKETPDTCCDNGGLQSQPAMQLDQPPPLDEALYDDPSDSDDGEGEERAGPGHHAAGLQDRRHGLGRQPAEQAEAQHRQPDQHRRHPDQADPQGALRGVLQQPGQLPTQEITMAFSYE